MPSAKEGRFLKTWKAWQKDPLLFMKEALGWSHLWSGMDELCQSVVQHQKTAAAGCHSSSKTKTATGIALWWLVMKYPSIVVTTSPKLEHLRDVFWAQLHEGYHGAKIPIGGELQTLHLRNGPDSFIAGITARKDVGEGGVTAMQGYKSPRLLLIMDEAVAIDRAYFKTGDALIITPESRWLAMSNPTNPNCGFRDAWRKGSTWNCINFDALKTPNFTDGPGSNPYTPTPEWVEGIRRDYGEGSPYWEARVRGRFPTAAIDTLISIADWEDALSREPAPFNPAVPPPIHLGVDIARQGDDLSVIIAVQADRILDLVFFQIPDLVSVAGNVKRVAREHGLNERTAGQISVDATGMGWGVVDVLKRDGWVVDAVDFGSKAHDEELWYDRRSEMWGGIKDWLLNEAALKGLDIGHQRRLEADLTGCTVDPGRVKGGVTVMKLEAKPDMKKRLGHSPDFGDALGLAISQRNRRRRLYDPRRDGHLFGGDQRKCGCNHPDCEICGTDKKSRRRRIGAMEGYGVGNP